MKTLYIFLTRSQTFLSRMVHLFTSDTYTHVSIAFEEDIQTMYSSARKNGRTMFPAGPCIEHIYSGYFRDHLEMPCAVYMMRVSDEVYEMAKTEVCNIMSDSDSYHYNIIGLMLCRLNIPYHRKKNFFCSQFVGEILSRSNALMLPKDSTVMRPSDYMNLPELTCLYSGTLLGLLHENLRMLVSQAATA